MKKFKHKISNNIAIETNSGKNYRVSNPQNFTIPKWIIENSEDWEEIKEEKIFEILEFGDGINRFYKKSDGVFTINLQYLYGESDLLNNTNYFITRVKRLRDDVIFEQGNKVKFNGVCSYKFFKIDNFYLRTHDNILLARSKDKSIVEDILRIEKLREPLFISEDAVEIFENDFPWILHNNEIYQWDEGRMEIGIFPTYDKSLKYFSTKEAAEKYVDDNELKFSKRQILDAFENSGEISTSSW